MGLYQFRYFGENDSRNQPNYTYEFYAQFKNEDLDWKSSGITDVNEVIKKVGIQTLPGAKVYLNGNINGITIGATGILELEAKNGAQITDLGFDTATLLAIKNKGGNNNNNNIEENSDTEEEDNSNNVVVLKEDNTVFLQDHCYLIMDVYTTTISSQNNSSDSNSEENSITEAQTEVI